MSAILQLLWTGLWLWVPPMAFSFALASRLPSAYQPDIFGKDIPVALEMTEHVSRIAIIFVSAFMVLQFDGSRAKLGMAIYLIGLAIYFASYWAQIASPDSAWSRSALGFAAPAWTTLIWIVGIGLIGERWFLPYLGALSAIFAVLTIVFVASHTAHALLVHSRL